MAPTSQIRTETTPLRIKDGTEMAVYFARPTGPGPYPGLLVLQEAFGVNAHIRDVAERFAREGYACVAPELFHRTAAPGFEAKYGDMETVMPHLKALTPAGLEADLHAAYDWLRTQPEVDASHIGSIGYCMGGRASFVANAALPLAAAVSYYGGGMDLGRVKEQHAPLILFWGGKDSHIDLEQRQAVAQALRDAGKPFTDVEFSEADHGFFCDARPSYHPPSARQSWGMTLEFFRERLKTS